MKWANLFYHNEGVFIWNCRNFFYIRQYYSALNGASTGVITSVNQVEEKFGKSKNYTYLCINKKKRNMGYTHYWGFKNNVAPKDIEGGAEKFANAANTIRKAIEKVNAMGIKIGNGIGENSPIITDTDICFNGWAKDNLDCETFSVSLNDGYEDFCKTYKKPYDLAVCLSLLALKEYFGDDFEYKSDGITKEAYENRDKNEYWKRIGFVPKGPEEEWQKAYEVWETLKTE